MVNAAIEIRDLNYTYPDMGFQALEDVNLTVEQGEFVLLVGPSGCGKSTLLQVMNGIIPELKGGKISGSVVVDGAAVSEHEIAQMAAHIGMVFQDPESQLTSVFVTDEVSFGPENFRIEPNEILKRVNSALNYVDLQDVHDRYVYELSGGQQQRLAISSVLAVDTPIVVLDDPTANLDPVGTAEIRRVLRQMRAEGRTVILATHALDEFIHLATKLVIMHEGAIHACGRPRDVLNEHGMSLSEDLGVWVPQLVELEMQIRELYDRDSSGVPLTVDEAIDLYESLEFDSSRFRPLECPGSDTDESVLEGDRLDFTYPDGTQALVDVSFDIRKGCLTAVLGPNGAGKSTLAAMMVGLEGVQNGELMLAGRSIKNLRADRLSRRVGFVFQNPEHQFVRDTVRDEIAYSLQVIGKSPEEVKRKADEMLQLFELEHLETRHPFSLSGGEKRRLSVAVMLVSYPELLILDEPTYGQDRNHVRKIMNLVQDQVERGVSVLFITHNIRLVEEFAREVLVLRDGQTLYQGPPEEMFDHLGVVQGETLKEPPLQALVRALRERGLDIHPHTRVCEQFVEQIVPSQVDKDL